MNSNSKILIASLFLPLCAASAQDYSAQDLVNYFGNLQGQYIKTNTIFSDSVGHTSLGGVFELKNGYALTPVGENEFNLEFTQDLFKLDADGFTRYMGGSDFLDAKAKFFSKLYFNNKTQVHDYPHHTLSGWLTLNHPPVKKLELPLEKYTRLFSPSNPAHQNSKYFDPTFQNQLDTDTGTELTFGNKLHALFNNNAIKEKTRLIKDAKRYIFGAVMATVCDPSSEEFVTELIAKAKSGVTVTLMMERFYMGVLYKKCTKRLREGGIDVVLVNDKWKRKTFLTFFHAKFWVRDGEEAVVGGQNIVEFENLSTGFNQMNRDTDLLIQGPAVTDFVSQYLELWEEHRRANNQSLESYLEEVKQAKEAQRLAHVRGKEFYGEKLSNPATRMNGACRILVQGPHNNNLSISATLKKYVEESQQSIILTSPELQFSKEGVVKPNRNSDLFFEQVRNAADRKVNVELILNGVDGGDGELTATMRLAMAKAKQNGRYGRYRLLNGILKFEPQFFARGHRKHLKDLQTTSGIRTWTHFNYMHAKQAYFDRIATSISSFNLDKASSDRNYESGAICMDESLSKEMEDQLTLDLINSVPVTSSNEYPEEEASEEVELSSQN